MTMTKKKRRMCNLKGATRTVASLDAQKCEIPLYATSPRGGGRVTVGMTKGQAMRLLTHLARILDDDLEFPQGERMMCLTISIDRKAMWLITSDPSFDCE